MILCKIVILVPWMLHGTYDFILTMGAESDAFATASIFVWIIVYIGGLVYARKEAVDFARACPVAVNIHSCIINDDVSHDLVRIQMAPYFFFSLRFWALVEFLNGAPSPMGSVSVFSYVHVVVQVQAELCRLRIGKLFDFA